MINIKEIDNELKKRILDFLYRDEVFNVFLINFIENQIEDMGELYIEESNMNIDSVLHLKFDGNSYFTSFYSESEKGYEAISKKIESLNYERVLLAGKEKDVYKILGYSNKVINSDLNIYYKFDMNKEFEIKDEPYIKFRQAKFLKEDTLRISDFMIDFFEAKTKEEIEDITDEGKLREDIKAGVYLLEYKNEIVGMARYSGRTKNYVDITTVYIDPKYRGKGFGKKIMAYMIDNIIKENKIPVTQTSTSNIIAKKTYESLGFIKIDDYIFEFIG